MANKPGLVARLFNRASKPPIVTKLFTHAIGQPLLVHPQLGEALIGAYLAGAVDVPHPLVEGPAAPAPAAGAASGGVVRVLNVSGALVNRPMPDACGPGPLSYEALGEAFDAAISDENVKAIILRMSSPGGMASGCFDLTDRMYAARGKKPVYAMIDDYAYSGGYAIAAPCDEIWVTRTGGVGSVGAVTWHYDWSTYESNLGLKVTPIFSGDRKVDFNPHSPLSEEAQKSAQAEIDRLGALFVDTIATYRGMSVEAVAAMQAGTFHGPEAVTAGLADRVGTMRDLLAHINEPPEADDATDALPAGDGEDQQDDAQPAPQAAANDDQQHADDAASAAVTAALTVTVGGEAIAGAVADAIAQVRTEMEPVQVRAALAEQLAGSKLAPAIVAAMLELDPATLTVEAIPARIEHARKVADLCAAAKLPEASGGFVKRHTDIDQVRAELAAAKTADPAGPIVTALPTGPSGMRPVASSQDVYSRRRAAAAGTGK